MNPHVRDVGAPELELGERSESSQPSQPRVRDVVALVEVQLGERREVTQLKQPCVCYVGAVEVTRLHL